MWEQVQEQIRRSQRAQEIQAAGRGGPGGPGGPAKRAPAKKWLGVEEDTLVGAAGWVMAAGLFAGLLLYLNRAAPPAAPTA